MQRYLLLPPILILLYLPPVLGQVSYGEVNYTATRLNQPENDLNTDEMPDALAEALQEMMRSGGFDQQYVLTFTPEAYTFWEIPRGDKTIEDGGITMRVVGTRTPDAFRTDLRTGDYTAVRSVADRAFYISDAAPVPDWTMTGETVAGSDATLGFDLRMATAVTASGDSLRAAYAPALPIPFGPMNVYGLPGAILQLDVCRSGSCERYQATKLKVLTEAPELQAPIGTKPISQAEYDKQQAKYEARMEKTMRRSQRD